MASSSSAHQNPRHLLSHLYGGGQTSAPPPTPSSQQPPSLSSTSDSTAADTLSRLLHRLPPNLSLPTRLSPRGASAAKSASPPPQQQPPLPTLSLSSTSSSSSSWFELGYFQLSHHSIPPQLAESAESDSVSLFELPLDKKLSSFPNEWPLGFNHDDEDGDENDDKTGSFCLDGDECNNITELSITSLRELTREMEKVGLEVVEKLACEVGFNNPFREGEEGKEVGPKKYSTLMCLSSITSDGEKGKEVYPYVVGVQYQIRARKMDLVSDSGSVIVEPQVGSLLVTLGDIAQVWSNGKLKKVRGRPAPVLDDANSSLPCISMTMLLTLPLETTVSPLLNIPSKSIDHTNRDKEAQDQDKESNISSDNNRLQSIDEPSIISTNDGVTEDGQEDRRVFNSFSFEDYAWRVYHERLHLKDPLDRYRVVD